MDEYLLDQNNSDQLTLKRLLFKIANEWRDSGLGA